MTRRGAGQRARDLSSHLNRISKSYKYYLTFYRVSARVVALSHRGMSYGNGRSGEAGNRSSQNGLLCDHTFTTCNGGGNWVGCAESLRERKGEFGRGKSGRGI